MSMIERSPARLLGACLFLAGVAAYAQAPAAPLAFEVASIRQADPINPAAVMSGKMRVGMSVDGSRVDIRFMSLADLVRTAYKIKAHQLVGLENSMTERFDIQATLPAGTNKDQVPEMLQGLLAERFKLKVHHDSKEQSVYALVVGKGGPKLKESAPDPAEPEGTPKMPSNQLSVAQDGKGMVVRSGQGGTVRMTMGPSGTMRMEAEKMTMEALAEALTGFMERPVVDQTALKGNYQVGLDLSMDDLRAAARKAGMAMPMGGPGGGAAGGGAVPEASDPSSSLFNTVQQLGLKLEPKKAPVPTIVVDHIEKTPTEN